MVDFARVQDRIYYGYGKAAIRLGTSHSIYRSADGINPITSPNLLGTQLISVDADLKYNRARKYGDMSWYFLPQDGLGTSLFALQNYDYMVGSTVTYFIADIAPDDRLSPPLCVECNATVSIISPINPITPGANTYQAYQPGVGTQRIQNCPASILQYSSGSKDGTLKLPSGCKLPFYQITLPDFDDVVIGSGDVLIDDEGRRMIISSAERTKKVLGFRLIAAQLGT